MKREVLAFFNNCFISCVAYESIFPVNPGLLRKLMAEVPLICVMRSWEKSSHRWAQLQEDEYPSSVDHC